MQILEAFSECNRKELSEFPQPVFSNLYKRVLANCYFEFRCLGENHLFSSLYSRLRGEPVAELDEFISRNEEFLNSLRRFILSSLFVYSALIEENAYILNNPQSIMICRMLHQKEQRFEIKFYSHYQEELLSAYNDKIYLGRDFINLSKFNRRFLGLKKYFLSLVEQNQKMQERAKHKLRYFQEYKKPYLDEIGYLTDDTVSDAMERMKLIPETSLKQISKVKAVDTLDHILYIQNLLLELRDFTREFDTLLRQREEASFVRYLTKFTKDLNDGIQYLRKLSTLLHLKISNYAID
ncbi:MAG: hypothetical protein RB296_07220 [Acidobacteriota bacterium]|nr:hypothetical protein [Acidobacteriota bacterium]